MRPLCTYAPEKNESIDLFNVPRHVDFADFDVFIDSEEDEEEGKE